MLQTTVIDPSATDSDALSTVVFVLGPDAARKLLASMPQHAGAPLQPTLSNLRPLLYCNKLDRQPLRGILPRSKKDPTFMIDRRLFVRGLSAAVAIASTLASEAALAQSSKADAEAAKQIARTTEKFPLSNRNHRPRQPRQ
jgi:hypothetical protein